MQAGKMVGQEESEGGFQVELMDDRGRTREGLLDRGQVNTEDYKLIEHYLVDTCKR